jgi:hypothetical protein
MTQKRGRGRPRLEITKKQIKKQMEEMFSHGKFCKSLPEWAQFSNIYELYMKTENDFAKHGVTVANANRNRANRINLLDLLDREVKERYSVLIAICGNREDQPFLLKEANSLAGKRFLPKQEASRKAKREEISEALIEFQRLAEAFVARKKFSISLLTDFLKPLLKGKRFTRHTVASILKGRAKTRQKKKER